MFAVIFEVCPKIGRWDDYLARAKMLRPELEKIDGFIENVRYRSLTREGWLLSLSTWRDEKALVRWRTLEMHHRVQEEGRYDIFRDYQLRVGEIREDEREFHRSAGSRSDETEVGEGKAVAFTEGRTEATEIENADAGAVGRSVARDLGLNQSAPGLMAWDSYCGVLDPQATLLMTVWRESSQAKGTRIVHVLRDYGMFDRREAPQYFPEIRPETSPRR